MASPCVWHRLLLLLLLLNLVFVVGTAQASRRLHRRLGRNLPPLLVSTNDSSWVNGFGNGSNSFDLGAYLLQEQQLIAQDRAQVKRCHQKTEGYLNQTHQVAQLTQSPFFDCWRPVDQVFEFLDQLVAKYPDFIVKQANASSTYEGRAVPVYKIFNGRQRQPATKGLYIQGLIHAREWQAGSSVCYAMASFLDDLSVSAQPDASMTSLFEQFELYFVPILNIDGYKYSWEVDRYWRKNRRTTGSNGQALEGVDLNRNFGPEEFFNQEKADDPRMEVYPGEKPFSEPESSGIATFLQSLNGLSGSVDVHTYGPLVLRPYGNQAKDPEAPFGDSMKQLGDSVRDAMSQNGAKYTSEKSIELYQASGCFVDYVFMAFNSTIPSITIEMNGDDFIQPQETIRAAGKDLYLGLKQFAKETSRYLEKVGNSSSVRKPDAAENSASSLATLQMTVILMAAAVIEFGY